MILKQERFGASRRLAFFTVTQDQAEKAKYHKLNFSSPEDIDCILSLDDQDVTVLKDALGCYNTYQDMIEKTGVKNIAADKAHFEIFQEQYDPPITDLSFELP